MHGLLRKFSKVPLEVEAASVSEAIMFLQQLFPEIRQRPLEERLVVQVLGFDSPASIRNPTEMEDIHIVPAFAGAGGGFKSFFQIIIGAVLVVAGVMAMGTPFAFLSNALIGMGASMVLGGLLSMISPAPQRDSGQGAADPPASKYLGAHGNTTQIGTRIPVGYGRFRVDGHYLSFDVQATDVALDVEEEEE